jgi:hypothetical protein
MPPPFKLRDRVTVATTLNDKERIRHHSHALVMRIDAAGYWVGHVDDYPELFGPYPEGRLTAGWGKTGLMPA